MEPMLKLEDIVAAEQRRERRQDLQEKLLRGLDMATNAAILLIIVAGSWVGIGLLAHAVWLLILADGS